jgi:hypothetical protein
MSLSQSAKRQKIKSEAMDYGLGYGGQSAAQFKIEDLTGHPVDLENEG